MTNAITALIKPTRIAAAPQQTPDVQSREGESFAAHLSKAQNESFTKTEEYRASNTKPRLDDNALHNKEKEAEEPHRSDLNGDGAIDLQDLNMLLKIFSYNKDANRGDINGDGQLNFFDISTFLNDFASHNG